MVHYEGRTGVVFRVCISEQVVVEGPRPIRKVVQRRGHQEEHAEHHADDRTQDHGDGEHLSVRDRADEWRKDGPRHPEGCQRRQDQQYAGQCHAKGVR